MKLLGCLGGRLVCLFFVGGLGLDLGLGLLVRLDGFHQQEINVVDPSFPVDESTETIPPVNKYALSQNYDAPRITRFSTGIDQAIRKVTRVSVTYSYLSVLLFIFVYFALLLMSSKWPDFSLGAYLDPFGGRAYTLATRYLSPAEANSAHGVTLGLVLFENRLLWLTISAAITAIAPLRSAWFR